MVGWCWILVLKKVRGKKRRTPLKVSKERKRGVVKKRRKFG